eukprot:EG_transcript_15688
MASTDSGFEGLFQLALGVGGVGLVAGQRAAERLRLGANPAAGFVLAPAGLVAGPASGGQQLARLQDVEGRVRMAWVPRVTFAGASFSDVAMLCYPGGEPADLQLTPSAAGLLAAPLFRGGCLVLDYAHRRASISELPDAGRPA